MKINNFAFVLITALFLFTSFTQAQKGYPYKSTEGKLSIVFPGDFVTEQLKSEDNVTIKTSCTVDDQTYFVTYTLHTLELTEPVELAEVSYDSFIKAVGGKLLSKSEWKIKKNVGIKARIELPKDESLLEYRVIIVGDIQYQVIALAAETLYDEGTAAAFFKSFKLQK